MNQPKYFVLASSSPRRRELLKYLHLDFAAVNPRVDEKPLAGELPLAYAQRNAQLKAHDVFKKFSDAVVIAADTIVVLGEKILEKPADEKDATRMLSALSGREHKVITGLCVMDQAKEDLTAVTTTVHFRKLSPADIAAYVATGEPMDKAGAYGAQAFGSQFIKSVVGSYTNVVGLPLAELKEILTARGS